MRSSNILADRYPSKRVLITGATSGLGQALALRFAAAGFRVAVAGRNPEKIDSMAEQVQQAGGTPLTVVLDVTASGEFTAAASAIAKAWGGLDIVINNAGIAQTGKLGDTSLESWQLTLDTNLWSVIHGCHAFIPLLQKSGGGHLVNVASVAGIICAPEMAAYNASKAAVMSISETLSTELAAERIDVTVSCPSIFKSSLFDNVENDGGLVSGSVGLGARDYMQSTSITSDDVAVSLLQSMTRRQLYNIPQGDARLAWFFSRHFPRLFRRAVLYLYLQRLWLFK